MDELKDIKVKLGDPSNQIFNEMLCLFCKKKSQNKLTLVNDKKDIVSALKLFGIQYEPVPTVLDYVCYTCVYRINFMIDFRRIVEKNINSSRANYFYRQGNNDMVRKYLSNNKTHKIYSLFPRYDVIHTNGDYNNQIVISDVRTETGNPNEFLFESFNEHCSDPSRSGGMNVAFNNYEISSPTKLLEPMYETSESVLVTESGGEINFENDKNTANRLNNKEYYQCQYCPKTYKRKNFLRKHERKHITKLRRARTNSSKDPAESNTFECFRCNNKYNTKLQLRNHEKSHKHRFKCPYCTAEFVLLADLEWHRAICRGKMEAIDTEVDTNNKPIRITRSRTTTVCTDLEEDDNVPETADSLYSERIRNTGYWVNNATQNYDDDMDDRISVRSGLSTVSSFSRASSVTQQTSLPDTDYYTDVSSETSPKAIIEVRSDYKINKGSDPTSKLMNDRATLYSMPKTRTVSGRIKKIDLEIEVRNNFNRRISYDNKQRMKAKKHLMRRMNMRGKLGEKQKNTFYNCPTCYHITKAVEEMMYHDMENHGKLPLYTCTVCKCRFTRAEYLRRHAVDHALGSCVCYLCEEEFQVKDELKLHLELHAIRSHQCSLCDMSFLKEGLLKEHRDDPKHENKLSSIKILERCNYLKVMDNNSSRNNYQKQSVSDDINKSIILYSSKFCIQNCIDFEKLEKYENLTWKLGSIKRYTDENITDNMTNSVNIIYDDNDQDEHDGTNTRNQSTRLLQESEDVEEKIRKFQENSKFRSYAESPVEYAECTSEEDEWLNITDDDDLQITNDTNLEELDFFSIHCLSPVSRGSSIDEAENHLTINKKESGETSGENNNNGKLLSTNTSTATTATELQNKKDRKGIINMTKHSKRALKHKIIMPNIKYTADALIPSYETLFSTYPLQKKIRRLSYDFDCSGPSRIPF